MKKQRFLACDLRDNQEFQSDVASWYSHVGKCSHILRDTQETVHLFRVEGEEWTEFLRVSAQDRARMKFGDEAALMLGALRHVIERRILRLPKYRHLLVRSKLRAGRSNYTTPTRKTGDWL